MWQRQRNFDARHEWASFTALSPNKCHLLARYRKTIKKELSPGLRTQRGEGRGTGRGTGKGRGGQRRVPSSIQEKMPQKPKMPTKLRQLRDATPGGSAALCCASREIKQSWREKCVVRAYMHVYVCVCVIVNKQQRDIRHTQISMHCTLKRKRNHKQKKEKPKTKLEESKS